MSARRPLHDLAAARRIEAGAIAALGEDATMARAGLAAWRAVLAYWPQAHRIVVACGPGNNGGDGYVLASHALANGRQVRVSRPASADGAATGERAAARAQAAFRDAGGVVEDWTGGAIDADLVVDALFGIGLSRPLAGGAARLVEAIVASGIDVLAIDVPSGVDAATGDVPGPAIRATRTLQCLVAHAGLATGAALDHVGVPMLATLDVPAACFDGIDARADALKVPALGTFLAPRRRDSHKGHAGRVLCIGGDHGHGGAALLMTEAALRSGVGLVDLATRAAHVPAALARRPEVMAHAVEEANDIAELAASADVIAIGPGLGRSAWAQALLDHALAAATPCVLDADALNGIAEQPRTLDAGHVLTPHPGEAARLLGIDTRAVQRDRYAAADALVARFGCVVVLKGAGTLVAAPGKRTVLIDAGNPGMAVGGMGDVLTGTIAALRAQGLHAFDAACAGALLHAAAGDRAADDGGQRGLLPSDLFPWLRRLSNP